MMIHITAMDNMTTPMIKQYLGIKEQYKDCLLFYRMGDFYELFMGDAPIGAQLLNITLTRKKIGKDAYVPMAGIPYHAVDAYLTKLVKAGYKVAVCEQLSPPNKKGLVERDVIRVVTPGTLLDEKALEKKENNYIISLLLHENTIAFAIADISTGYFALRQVPYIDLEVTLQNEFSRIQPSECILPDELYNNQQLLYILRKQHKVNIFCFQDWSTYALDAQAILSSHFSVTSLAMFGLENEFLLQQVAAALLGYLQQTQKTTVQHITNMHILTDSDHMQLDRSTIINLELFSTLREHTSKGSLLSVVDQTITPMGGRMMRQWIKAPLSDREKVQERHTSVAELCAQEQMGRQLKALLSNIADIERILSRLSVKIGNARDLINLKHSINIIVQTKNVIEQFSSPLLQDITNKIDSSLIDIVNYIERHIVTDPPISLREGNLIKTGVNKELDELKDKVCHAKEWITNLEKIERDRTGINSLKVRFNSVFGYYIEVSKSHVATVPSNYYRKQTLVNGERYITPELKKQEEIILSSEEKLFELEYQLFWQFLENILSYTQVIQQACQSISQLDCLMSFAKIATERKYVHPEIVDDTLHITAGRHPVVETLMSDERFVPNDISLKQKGRSLLLITGPNMAGKSVYIRQIALMMLLNQIGCFVPAEEARLPIVDRIFVRSGANDVITEGLSTFMVEMVETSYILRHATEKSLIVMDEIGRGTSTYDGISIAWAVAEYLVTHFSHPPKTLFATHYHELQKLEEEYPTYIKNFHMATDNQNDQPVFLHTLLEGPASHSFGIAVAKLAGVPEGVVKKANKILKNLEQDKHDSSSSEKSESRSKNLIQPVSLIERLISKELQSLDISQMTPLEALNKLAELKEQMKLFNKEEKRDYLGSD